ncbi:MAG: prepilin peptidase [Betaproteobacteria bacterium]|nr:prepilin peptidase [Betaproteobacteria bacterium]
MISYRIDARATLPTPGLVYGDYPERRGPFRRDNAVDLAWKRGISLIEGQLRRDATRHRRFADEVLAQAKSLLTSEERTMQGRLETTRAALVREGLNDTTCLHALALACVACKQRLGVFPYVTQIMAARVMLDWQLAEMATGEGKTIAIALAAATAALAGAPVHVITSNDYLAARDARALKRFYASMHLRAAVVTQDMPREARARAYGADVTYCTAKELAFDYLRDNMLRPNRLGDLEQRARRISAGSADQAVPLLRGLCVAFVDEADTILIDEARIPLVLSRSDGNAENVLFLESALACAGKLLPAEHYMADTSSNSVTLTASGQQAVADWPFGESGINAHPRHREDTTCMALAALHLFVRDRDYVVRDGAVEIVDETTGRRAPGRAWSRGLHQLIECKERCAASIRNEPEQQITYQRFFRRYLHLGGMSGTLRECIGELRLTYDLAVIDVPLRLPSQRRQYRPQLFSDNSALYAAVVARTREMVGLGRPVLIGLSSVAESATLSAILRAANLQHAVLNASQDDAEAAIVGRAGMGGQVTVATSMAGRGTDIAIDDDTLRRGGLHIILCQHNASRRIDRQFIGRAARRGEPGSVEILLSQQSRLLDTFFPGALRVAAIWMANRSPFLFRLIVRLPQLLEERNQSGQRQDLKRADEQAERNFAFSARTLT